MQSFIAYFCIRIILKQVSAMPIRFKTLMNFPKSSTSNQLIITMKKAIIFVLLAALSISLNSCSSVTEVTGTWKKPGATSQKYNKIVVLGGGNGSTSLYRLSANGTVSSIANAQIGVGISQSIFTVDPVSGKFLLFGSSREFFEYNPATNGWSSVASSSVPMFRGGSNAILYRAAVPISTHGVIAFLAEGGSADSRVFLYRHTTGPSAPPMDTTPPIVPTGLVVN